MTAISVSELCFEVGTKKILNNVSFSLEEGDRLAIVGVNGSGKSTLLRLIAGKYEATSGSVYTAKNKTVGMMEQDDAVNFVSSFGNIGFDSTVLSQMYAAYPELCVAEHRLAELEKLLNESSGDELMRFTSEFTRLNNEFISSGGLHYKSRCKSLLLKLGLGEEKFSQNIESLSGGERARLNLAKLLFREPDILILDEPTNHLDTDTLEWLEGVLANYKKTLITVSHDRYFLDSVTEKTLDIEYGVSKLYSAPYSEYVKLKEEYKASELKKYTVQQKEISRLEAYIEQQRRWNRERNIIAAESREKAIARMEKVERPKDAPKSIRFEFSKSEESGNDVLSVKNLSKSFGEKELFSDISFEVKKKERLFIAGANGVGKSTLLKILLRKISADKGSFEFGYNVTVGYYDQENQNLDFSKTVIDELWDAYPDTTETQLRNILALFMFRGDDAFKSVSVLSGGERARLTLAKLILSKMNLLILDEPTNHLDIQSREALEKALDAFEGTVIAVSHDRYFTKKTATRILELTNGTCINHIDGYSGYSKSRELRRISEKITPDENSEKENSKSASNKNLYLQRKKENADARRLKKRKKDLAAEIAKTEKKIEEITAELYGDAAADYTRAAELDSQKTELEDKLLELYEEEEALSRTEAPK